MDVVPEVEEAAMPFEVKYLSRHSSSRDLNGIPELCHQKKIERGYVVTRAFDDSGVMSDTASDGCKIMKLLAPAPLHCY